MVCYRTRFGNTIIFKKIKVDNVFKGLISFDGKMWNKTISASQINGSMIVPGTYYKYELGKHKMY